MATASPNTAANSTRRKGGKRPPTDPTNGPSAPSVNEASGSTAKKAKTETSTAQKNRAKKEGEAISTTIKIEKKNKESGASGDEQQDKENHDNRQILAFGWTSEELSQLISNLTICLPKYDNVKYSTLIEKLDWEKVRFGNYSASECKEKWMQIMTKLRRFRTLTDMITDAKEWLKHPWSSYCSSKKQKHPEMPKKPLTPYFRYFLEKRQKYSREHPDMSMTELAKVLSKKYQQLPEKKKQKYKENYEKENEVYKQELEKFKREHPDQFPQAESKHHPQHEGPYKPHTPFQLFMAEKMKKAEFAETELGEYSQSHPSFKPDTIRSVLSKAEKELKDRFDGKPDRPPNLLETFMLTKQRPNKKETESESSDDSSGDDDDEEEGSEKSGEDEESGSGSDDSGSDSDDDDDDNEDSDEEKKEGEESSSGDSDSDSDSESSSDNSSESGSENFFLKWIANEQYREKYAAYVKSLPEEERIKLESENKKGGKKKIVNENTSSENDDKKTTTNEEEEDVQNRPKKPLSAMFYFQQEKLDSFREKNPDISKQEVMRLLAREYSELPEKKKEKYKKLAEAAKKQSNEESKSKDEVHETGSRKPQLFKGEPKKPPQSGYSLFTTEMLGAVTDVDAKNRMAVTAQKWNALSQSEKDKYRKKSQEMMKKYNKDIEKFIAGLSEAEREEYYRLKSRTKGSRSAAKAAKDQAATKQGQTKPNKKETESESSDDSSGDDDDEEEGSEKSGEDEESGSGSDDSGSDSDDDDDDNEDSDEEKKEGEESSSGDSDSDSDSESSSDNSSESGSESEN
ncbi:nucleolar transcription factor 1-like [Centruroides sculpturatus]|uniref:nucleolar transcription factor 1-like n=2 Tax=Centruroides sculpturatus TaxID=218467 RepID=UPI000C6D895C|nr:nucleolar transcription factor 1-like [Centruroides sculpturatus]